jgi:bifunctional non-homologous end joining protein LigD
LAGSDKHDALGAYRDKRDPARTPEPFSAEHTAERPASTKSTFRGRFVVHLHDASRRHYDLRLEVGGVLKSFAVPKGPTLDPSDKRLAVNTEDHPLLYLDFEDVIPAGNYGAGSMIVWDEGRVTYLEGSAEDGIERGKIDFSLGGHKLRGRFALVHTGGRAGAPDNQWLLIKKQDVHARAGEITAEQPHSVLSGLLVEELAEAGAKVARLAARADALGAPRAAIDTRTLSPMLCAQSGAELCDPSRIYELKLDGVRIVADKRAGAVELRYRKQRSGTAAYPEVARAVASLPAQSVVLDGEIVAFDEEGRPSFQRLGRRIHLTRPLDVSRARIEVPVTFMVFDLLELEGRDLTGLALLERKALLAELLPGRGILRALDHLDGDGRALFAFCREHRLEGVVAKQKFAPYRPGPKRSEAWVKIKCQREADFVVVGWEESDKARKLRSLILAAHDDTGALILRGKVGSGLDDATIDYWLETLAGVEQKKPAASGSVTRHGRRHWVRPERVVNVEFGGLSESGTLRFPVYRGLRPDVDPEDCVLVSSSEAVDHALSEEAQEDEPAGDGIVAASEVAVRAVLTNQSKVFWPETGYTKGDLCNYYASVAEALLPFLEDRPIVLVRYPDGIAGKSFFQWNVPRGTPSWLRHVDFPDDEARGKRKKRMFLIDDIDGLLHVANLGCIPIHVIGARESDRERADFLTIDLDIGDRPFAEAVSLALSLRSILDDIGLSGFPKTSGQSGLHVLVPLGATVGWDTARALGELLGRLLEARHGNIATMERRVEARGGRVYIDTGQTGRSRTIVAPYSARAVAGATVSTPLSWDELHLALDPTRFSIFTVPARLAAGMNPLGPMLATRPDVALAVAALGRLFSPGA